MVIFTLDTINAQAYKECIVLDFDDTNVTVTDEQLAAAAELVVVYNVTFWQLNDANGNYSEPITQKKY